MDNTLLTQSNVADIYPLSPMQKGMLFHSVYESGAAMYVEQLSLGLQGRIDAAAFESAWNRVVEAHAVLRTVFRWRNLSEPAQVVLKRCPFKVQVVELDGVASPEATSAAVDDFLRRDRHAPLPLDTGPLMRVTLLRTPERDVNLVWTFHHILLDGWSLPVLMGEVMSAYEAVLAGREHRSAARPPFRDYIAWLKRQDPQAAMDFWAGHLRGLSSRTPLPLALRDGVRSHAEVDEYALPLAAELGESLTRRARELRITPNALFQAAWALLLGRLGGEADVVYGTTVSGRPADLPGVEAMVGQLTNTLPVRLQLDPGQTVGEVAAAMQQQIVQMAQHGWIELPRLRALTPFKGSERMFEILFVFENYPMGSGGEGGLRFDDVRFTEMTSFPLTVVAAPVGGSYLVRVEYAREAYDAARVERLMALYRRMLEAVARGPGQRIGEIDLLDDAERARLAAFNATDADPSGEPLLHQRIEAQVRRTPRAPAVVFEDEVLSYAELNARANQLAHALRERGVGPDRRVAVCMERSTDMVVALLGILKAGGAYVPLDPGYPADRLAYMLGNAQPAVLLTQAALKPGLPEAGVPAMSLDELGLSRRPSHDLPAAELGLSERHLAYVIYTSGSTGQPKGAMNEHRAVVNRLAWMQQAYRLQPGERVLQKTPFSFDVSVWEFFWTLAEGATLVVARPEGHKDPAYLAQLIEQAGIGTLHFVPSMLQIFLDHLDGSGRTPGSLKRVVCSGEALPWALQQRCLQRLPQAQLYNLYGPTEAAVDVTHWHCRANGPRGLVPIGAPIANTRIHILDERLQRVPIGVAGEIHIGGVAVGRGYLNQPELTRQRFIDDPFEPGGKLYKTGDLGRWRDDGTVEYLGRNDFQVKIRGLRIELGEIEARLASHPSVREAVVLAREDRAGDPRLVAYLVPPAGHGIDADVLRAHLLKQLPEHMVPQAWVVLEALPLSPNGKLDRKALPVPGAAASQRAEYEAPRGETEQALARIWRELLQVERIGRDDNFFELGGHSLLAMTLAERMRKAGLPADMRTLFAQPTLRALAAAVGHGAAAKAPPNLIASGCERITPEMLSMVSLRQDEIDLIASRVPGGHANVQDIYPLAPLQHGVLFHHLASREGDPYVLDAVLSFDTRERFDRYIEALQAVNDRHDILRTAVMWEGLAQPVQVVYRQAALVVEEVALDPAGGDVVQQLRERFDPRHYRLDVQRAPLSRFFVSRDEPNGRWVAVVLNHHLVVDHTGLALMQQEVQAVLEGRGGELPPAPAFRDFVAQALGGASEAEHEAFFKEMLASVDEPTAPFGVLDVQGSGAGVAEARREVDADLVSRLRLRARTLGVSVASLCHFAWAQVLARLTGRDDVVFGTVLFGRMQGGQDAERVLGLFINTLPLRLRIDRTPLLEAVRGTHALLARLIRHEHATLALAQRCSAIAAPAPLFTSLLNYRHNAPLAATAAAPAPAGGSIALLSAGERTNYPVAMSIDDHGDALVLDAQVLQGLDPLRLCSFMHRALAQIVDTLERTPGCPADRLDVLPEAERAQLARFNATEADYPSDRLLHELVEAQVRRTPQALAVVAGDVQLSYSELNAKANRLAHHLRSLGVGPDGRVAICSARRERMMVALLAVLKAGGAYVPLDPAYPSDRLAYILQDSAPLAVLADAHGLQVLESSAGGLQGLRVLDLAQEWAGEPGHDLERAGLQTSHLAYVIYTSGSTGQPKGVAIEHRNAVNFVSWALQAFEAKDFRRSLLATSINFDLAVYEAFVPLAAGGTVQVVDNALALIEQPLEVTLINTVPSAMNALVQAAAVPATAQVVNLAGEALKRELVERIFECSQAQRVCNLYGPTETTTYSTWVEMRREGGFVSHIGRPIFNTSVYVLDAQGRPAPIGVAGEIHIGGDGVARGYLNQPRLTEERFIADPFSTQPHARMYKTGDLGRWLPDGTIEYLGRNDFQVKIRGFRIELGEIEAKLATLANEVVVLAREDQAGDKRLVAYYTGQAGADQLKAHATATLPSYMVPSAYVQLEALPLSPNGKLDRKALPAPDDGAFAHGRGEAPQGEVEVALARIWRELLGVDSVGRHDSFFDLGGHSLLAIRLANAWATARGEQVPVRAVFDTPTLAGLAATLGRGPALPPIRRLPARDCHPLSHAQRRIWFLVQLEGAQSAYNMPTALRLRGALDRARLHEAVQALARRHDSLRTTFITVDGEPMQWIADEARIPVDWQVVPPGDEAGRLAAVEAALTAFIAEPFNLETGPVLRVCVHELAPDDHVLALVLHHIVGDGWSVDLMVTELCNLYAQPDGRAEPLPVQYADYASWQRGLVAAGRFEPQRAYWLSTLADLPTLHLPVDRPRPALQSFSGSRHTLALDAALHRRLESLGREQGATLFMLMLAACKTLLARLCGQSDIVLGTPVAGRSHPQVEGLIGIFANTLALRTRLDGKPRFSEVLERVRHTTLQAFAHQDYPFDLLVEELGVQRDLSQQAVFNTAFVFQTVPVAGPQPVATDLSVEAAPFAFEKALFDLSFTVAADAQGLSVQLEYNTDLFDHDSIVRMADSYACLLQAVADDPSAPIDELPLLDAARRDELVRGFGAQRRRYEPTDDLASRFERQADRVPGHVAVVCGEQSITYAELERRANQLARHLLAHRVGRESPVAICLERSIEQIVAILAVLKAGGCYLPIEPGYPDERIAFMVRDTGARVAIGLGDTAERLAACAEHVVCLSRDAQVLAQAPAGRIGVRTHPQQLAYIIYTSGSTGRPKGSLLTHANALRLFDACDEHYRFDEQDAWTLFHSYCFDFSVWEIFGALLHGGRLVVVPQLVARSPQETLKLAETQRVTVLSQTPSAFLRLLDASGVAGRWQWSESLRYVVFGGEALDYAALRPWFQQRLNPATSLVNMYGITETTVHVTYREVVAADVNGPGRRVGRALADLSMHVLDPLGQPQPVGVTGELYVGGAGLARGYLGRPGLTAQRFVPDPFGGEPGARLYRTGDLARWRADGELEYLGRIDQQVKIRGHRIEPGEIEAAMLAHEAVTGALVVAAKDRAHRDNLLVYYTGPESVTTSALRGFLAQSLPEYMIPFAFVHLREFPLTANGKIDRAKLPHVQTERPQLDVAYAAPRSAMERQLAAIWAEVLQVDRVGVHDNFFDLGGESFSAYRVMARVSSDIGKELPVSTIFQAQTVGQMAECVHAAIDADDDHVLIRLNAGAPGRRPFFCVHPAGGDVLGFQDLARALGDAQPFYGLQSRSSFLDASYHASIEEMAACYVQEIRAVQPLGPYLLGGHSLGAVVSFEMARQIEAAGERIGVLALMDGEARSQSGLLDTLLLVSDTFELGVSREDLSALPESEMMNHVMRKSKKRFARVLEIAYDMDILPRGFRTRDAEQFMARIASNIDLASRYRLQPLLQHRAHLFTAAQESENTAPVDIDLWRRYTPAGLTVIEVPGNHMTLVKRPHVDVLAQRLLTLFGQVERDLGAPDAQRDPALSL